MDNRCEMAVGVTYHGPAPVIQKCGKPGSLRPAIFRPFGVFACDDCYDAFVLQLRRPNAVPHTEVAHTSREGYDAFVLRLRHPNAVPHTEVAHASREGPAEVPGDEVPASAQRGSEQAVEPGAEGVGGDQGEVRGGGRA